MTDVIRCSNLVKRYDDVLAVDGISFEVRRGECFGLLGPNGAGKTTTVEIFEGLLSRDSGEVEVLGESWERAGRRLRERIGITLQETRFIDKLTVLETLTLFRSFYQNGIDPHGCARPSTTGIRCFEVRRHRRSAGAIGPPCVGDPSG